MSQFPVIIFLLFSLFFPSTILAEYLYDTNGDALEIGNSYYLMSIVPGNGGGLDIARVQDYHTRCPYYSIIQAQDDRCGTDFGIPAKFMPADPQQKNLTLSTEMVISFDIRAPRAPYYCDQPTTTMTMASHAESGDMSSRSADLGMVHFGGLRQDGDGDDDTKNSLFMIVKNKAYGYRIRYCPNNSENSGLEEVTCGDLAAVYNRRLGLRVLTLVDRSNGINRPFEFMVIKA